MIDGIKKLYGLVERLEGQASAIDLEQIVVEIEAEIEEKYILLPVDADGVPIHLGDNLKSTYCDSGVVSSIEKDADGWMLGVIPDGWDVLTLQDPIRFTHYETRTVEDVLRDVVTLCNNTWKDEKSAFDFLDVDDVMNSANVKDFADELRKIIGGAE